MAETMIERVARAICVASGLDPDRPFSSSNYSKETEPQEFAWHEYLPEARAAINAMREPTESMVENGADSENTLEAMTDLTDAQSVRNIYHAMIDRALKD